MAIGALAGDWTLDHNENYDDFLKAVGKVFFYILITWNAVNSECKSFTNILFD